MAHGRRQRLDALPPGVARDDLGRGQVQMGANRQALLARPVAAVGPPQPHPYGARHPALEEAGRHPAGPTPRDPELAVQDPRAVVDRQRVDPLPRRPRAVLARPATAAAWSARSRRARPTTVWPSATAALI